MPLPPLGKEMSEEALWASWEILEELNHGSSVSRIEGVEPPQVPLLKALGFRLLPGESEYLYSRSKLASLKGDPYRSQRWAVNHCKKGFQVKIRPFADGDLVSCLKLYTLWGIRRQHEAQEAFPKALIQDGLFFHRRLMMSHQECGLTGWVAEVDGQIRGYTFGSPISEKIFCGPVRVAHRF